MSSDEELWKGTPLETSRQLVYNKGRHKGEAVCVSHLADILQGVGCDGEVHRSRDDFGFLRLQIKPRDKQ